MIKIRKAQESDFPRIFEIEKKSYTPQLQAPHEILKYRSQTFGIWVAENDGEVRGFFTCVPAQLNWPNPDMNIILKNRKPYYKPWFEKYSNGGKFDTLYVTSTAVESDFQNKGLGTELVKFSLNLAKELKLSYRASALRCEYAKYYGQTKKSIQDYIEEVRKGNIKDRFLQLYLKLGFTLGDPLPNYEPYKGSMNYNIFAFKKL